MDKPVVKELIQNDLTVNNLKKELSLLLFDETKQQQVKKDYEDLKHILSAGGNFLVWLDRLCPPLANWVVARWG